RGRIFLIQIQHRLTVTDQAQVNRFGRRDAPLHQRQAGGDAPARRDIGPSPSERHDLAPNPTTRTEKKQKSRAHHHRHHTPLPPRHRRLPRHRHR
uniref:Uncharacterized protein n=1 Tax=Aegilops tauschii subsp. strangulata TaxID=200361 RepID=A0A453IQ15_AEGTS